MVVISSVPPFFKPSAPPSTVPPLTAHTEFGKASNASLMVQELPIPFKPKTVRFVTAAAGSTAPSPIVLLHSTPTSTNGDDYSMDSSLSSDDSDGDSEDQSGIVNDDEDTSEDDLIPKPEGENGQPGRGGYNLELALGWDSKAFRKFKVCFSLNCDLKNIINRDLGVCSQVCSGTP